MLNRGKKFWGMVIGAVAALVTGVVAIFIRVIGYGANAAKVVATSTAIAAAIASVVATDKGAKDLEREVFAAVYKDKLAPLFRESSLDKAKKCLGEIRSEVIANQGSEGNVVRSWLAAAEDKNVSEERRQAALDYISQEYRWQEIEDTQDLEPYVVVALRQWTHGDPEKALEYSIGLLGHLCQNTENTHGGLDLFLRELPPIPSKDVKTLEHRRTLATVLSETFPANTLDIGTLGENAPGGKQGKGKVLADKNNRLPLSRSVAKGVCIAISRELFRTGSLDEAFAYFTELLSRARQAEENISHQFSEGLVNQMVELTREGLSKETAEQMIHLAASQTKPEWYAKAWSVLLGGVKPEERLAYYQALLQRYGDNALVAAGGLLTESPKSANIQDIIAGHCAIISMEIEALAQSRGLQHLITELNQRNAEAQIQEVCEFFWRHFPTEPIGYQALREWIQCQKGIAGEALIAEACCELSESYPQSPIGDLAKLALARTYIWRGQVLEGLLMAGREAEEKEQAEAELSLSDLRSLVDNFVQKAKNFEWETGNAEILMGLGEQLYQAEEFFLAASIYWSVAEAGKFNFNDPRTGLPVDPPNTNMTEPSKAEMEAKFWRAIGFLATSKEAAAIKVMEELMEAHPTFRHAGLVHLFLAKCFDAKGAVRQAWKHIEACPKSIRDTKEASALYAKLAAVAPEEFQRIQDEQRIETIKKDLLANPKAPGTDEALMELASLLARRRKYTEAALNYEAVFKQHEMSSLCPEALYRAITIYRTQVPNPERVKHLAEILRKKYPKSRYALLLEGQT